MVFKKGSLSFRDSCEWTGKVPCFQRNTKTVAVAQVVFQNHLAAREWPVSDIEVDSIRAFAKVYLHKGEEDMVLAPSLQGKGGDIVRQAENLECKLNILGFGHADHEVRPANGQGKGAIKEWMMWGDGFAPPNAVQWRRNGGDTDEALAVWEKRCRARLVAEMRAVWKVRCEKAHRNEETGARVGHRERKELIWRRLQRKPARHATKRDRRRVEAVDSARSVHLNFVGVDPDAPRQKQKAPFRGSACHSSKVKVVAALVQRDAERRGSSRAHAVVQA